MADEILSALLSHLEKDVKLDQTHAGGYTPTARVLQQRDWSAQMDRVEAIGREVRADFYMERYIADCAPGFRDNRDPVAYDQAAQALAAKLRAEGCTVRCARRVGLIWALQVSFSAERAAAVADLHPKYVAALEAAKRQ